MTEQRHKNAEVNNLKVEEDSIGTAVGKDGNDALCQNSEELDHLHDRDDGLDVVKIIADVSVR